jgi:hypothetical protein
MKEGGLNEKVDLDDYRVLFHSCIPMGICSGPTTSKEDSRIIKPGQEAL